ncbi:Aste57867_21300 [Aphanomyces stellatus]|uniref:Aste57867_21300 protein n=1 Tax=Aphanomyces stellatus TaxID=120398 RepID=A0A485LH47_9STRA|nr:hypothetical protein As57867_021231 [Aphanomyces stellatus]VFT97972.1 Aste57867_21300 [Aphanomyces stellatus]
MCMLLRNLAIDFTRTRLIESTVVYHVVLRNVASGRTWEMAKPFGVYHTLKEALQGQIKPGHLCADVCPWLFAHLKSNFPRSHLFGCRWPSVTTARLQDLDDFFSNLVGIYHHSSAPKCHVIADDIPKILVAFFYGPTYVLKDLEATLLSSPRRKTSAEDASSPVKAEGSPRQVTSPVPSRKRLPRQGTFSPLRDEGNTPCTICGRLLQELDVVAAFDEEVDLRVHAPEQISLTSLPCGHSFHDECILVHLNEVLRCPTCSHELAFEPSRRWSVNQNAAGFQKE